MNSVMSPVSLTSYFSPEDQTVIQADLYFYTTSSLDPIAVYKDALLSQVHAQPVKTGGSGRVPPVFVGEIVSYRMRALDAVTGVVLEDIDDIPGALPDAATPPDVPTDVDPTTLFTTGDMKMAFTNGASLLGWVRANGGTIGAGGAPYTPSGATERANNDTQALYLHLWQQDSIGLKLTVVGGRGATASGDFAAGKQITLPDYRGRFLAGLDDMGSGLMTNRLVGGLFTAGTDGQYPSEVGGDAKHVLTITQLPQHCHVFTDPGHVHGVADNWHGHTIGDPTHTHTTTTGSALGGYELLDTAEPGVAGGFSGRAQVSGVAGAFVNANYTGIWIVEGPSNVAIQNHVSNVTIAGVSTLANEAQTVDQAHNNLPPFSTVCIYLRL
jgi:hypothetical protein